MRWPIRGIIAFLLIWGAIFAVPLWRNRTLSGAEQRGQYLPDFVDLDLDNLLRKSPNDPLLQSLKLQKSWDPSMTVLPDSETTTFQGTTVAEKKQHYNIATNGGFFRDFDKLIAKYPRDLALRRTRLRLSIQSPFMGEGHFLSYLRRKHKNSIPLVIVPKDASELSPTIVQKILTQARQAAQLEPRNGFFPAIEAMALVSLKRYDEALVALEQAARCPDFNDGHQDQFIQRLNLYAQTKPLSWDQKLVLSVGVSTPFYGSIRSLYRDLIFRGIYLYEAGRKEEAWKHWIVPMKFAASFRRAQEPWLLTSTYGRIGR